MRLPTARAHSEPRLAAAPPCPWLAAALPPLCPQPPLTDSSWRISLMATTCWGSCRLWALYTMPYVPSPALATTSYCGAWPEGWPDAGELECWSRRMRRQGTKVHRAAACRVGVCGGAHVRPATAWASRRGADLCGVRGAGREEARGRAGARRACVHVRMSLAPLHQARVGCCQPPPQAACPQRRGKGGAQEAGAGSGRRRRAQPAAPTFSWMRLAMAAALTRALPAPRRRTR